MSWFRHASPNLSAISIENIYRTFRQKNQPPVATWRQRARSNSQAIHWRGGCRRHGRRSGVRHTPGCRRSYHLFEMVRVTQGGNATAEAPAYTSRPCRSYLWATELLIGGHSSRGAAVTWHAHRAWTACRNLGILAQYLFSQAWSGGWLRNLRGTQPRTRT